jgi:hypothetical protein
MGFFKSLKGKADVGTDSDYQPSNTHYSSGNHDELSTANDKRRMFGFSSSSSRSQHSQQSQPSQPTYNPPPSSEKHTYQPPPGPPPPRANPEPPPYHDWTSVPDTSQLPPPPSFFSEQSINNASTESAEAAHAWCDRYPPYAPTAPNDTLITASLTGNLSLERPPNFARSSSLTQLRPGTYSVKTKRSAEDTIILSNLPIYFAAASNPLHTEVARTIYFEVQVQRILDPESALAVGFAAKPYPPWRLPGWHRASIGVHSDDGRRYINDSWGGVEFVRPFQEGEVVGVGMRFGREAKTDVTVKTRCFFVRDGREVGGWDVDEERDRDRDEFEGVAGLEGEGDLYAAVGLYGGVEFEVRLRPEDWLFRPE